MFLYIDPGTGSMLFTILIGLLGAVVYAFKKLYYKIRFMATGSEKNNVDEGYMPLVIYTDSKTYWNVFKPICDELEKRKIQTVYMTSSPDDPVLNAGYEFIRGEFIGEGNGAFAKLNAIKAGIVLSSTPGLDVYQWKRSRDAKYYVHIPHSACDITVYHMFGIDFYDALLLVGDYEVKQVRDLEKLRNLPEKETVVVGVTYLDELKKKLDSTPPLGRDHERTVLLAPSWGESSIFARYGGKIIEALLQTGYHIIIRPHPQSFRSEKEMIEKLQHDYPESSQLEWNRDNNNFDALNHSDIIISDFSGVIFDFALVFDKPVIYADTSFDKAPYDACWLEEEMWTFETLPRIGAQLKGENLNQIKELIDDCLMSQRFAEGRERARREAWAHIGEAASRTVDYLENKLKTL